MAEKDLLNVSDRVEWLVAGLSMPTVMGCKISFPALLVSRLFDVHA